MKDVTRCRPAVAGTRAGAKLALMFLAGLLLAACASNPAAKKDEVVKRAEARWNALVTGELEEAYTYYSPGYRSTHSLIDFGMSIRTRRVQWTSAKYLDHSCEGSRCIVRFEVGYRASRPVPGINEFKSTAEVEDIWIRMDGQWWYAPEK